MQKIKINVRQVGSAKSNTLGQVCFVLPLVPIRVKILSTLPKEERTAGTKLPVCAIIVRRATCLR
jgi:hypothetical protein